MTPQHEHSQWVFARGDSYLKSARIGLVYGLWWFPTSLVRNLREPVLDLIVAILTIAIGLAVVVGSHAVFLVAGFLGFLKDADDVPQDPSRNPQGDRL